MKLKLTLVGSGGREDDLLVTAEASYSIGDIASAIILADPNGPRALPSSPATLRIVDGAEPRVLSTDALLEASGLHAGSRVAITTDGSAYSSAVGDQPVAGSITVTAGPDAGRRIPLRFGSNQVGRDAGNEIRLSDPLVSKVHARLNVGEQIEIIDLGSSNGIQVRGATVARAVLAVGDMVIMGDTVFEIAQHTPTPTGAVGRPLVEFNRSPRLDPVFHGDELIAPTPPVPPQAARFPMVPLIAPVVMASIMFAITRNPTSVLFVALSPLMMVGSFVENRTVGRKAFAAGESRFRAALKDLEIQMHYALDQEKVGRRAEHPATVELLRAITDRSPLLWSRRPDQRAFLSLRLGLGTQLSRNSIKLPSSNNTTPELWRELIEVPRRYAYVPEVPLVAELPEVGSFGIAGPLPSVNDTVRSAVLQLVGMHSPAEVVLCAVIAPEHASEWEWLKWLPHCTSDHSPLGVEQLAVASSTALLNALEALVDARVEERRHASSGAPMPRIVLLVDDAAALDRAQTVDLLERGGAVGVHAIWFAASQALLPAACRVFMTVDSATGLWSVGDVREGQAFALSAVDACSLVDADRAARRMAPMTDAGAPTDDDSDIPRAVSFLNLSDPSLATATDTVVAWWRASSSLPSEYPKAGERRRLQPGERKLPKRDINLSALVGTTGPQLLTLDLRTQGPHALVGGTTGAGKSEFLQTWVMGMAAAHSPARVNFLFVDYKGGAAFGDCVELPHAVGLVTDLSPHLVRRALVSLKAELRHREELLQSHKATDLVSLEKSNLAAAPPSLIIIVDEFAALAKEVPEFVDGVVDVAQRGRSLGLHLILATQQPSGVIKGNLRANTNLRVALRMADEEDSQDVVGTKQAALFDHIPGRAVAKLGPGRLTTFQTAYVGGWTTGEPPRPVVTVEELRLGGGVKWEAPDDDSDEEQSRAQRGPNDLKRLVRTLRSAASAASIAEPRRPWQPDLPLTKELAELKPSRTDRQLVFGLLDDPANQVQGLAAFEPDRDGHMAIFGTGGSGKSATLRSLAVAAGLSTDGPCHVYGLDFGSRGLNMLEPLPHVGSIVAGDDAERVSRLIRWLRATVDERGMRYAQASAGSVTEYRRLASRPDEPRILVLLDGFGAFRQAYESGTGQAVFDMVAGLAADGRPVGVHFVITADRPSVIPGSLGSNIQKRLVLRLAQENDYGSFGVPSDAFTTSSPPGRAFFDGYEVQVAVLGGQASTARQTAAIAKLAGDLRSAKRWEPATPIRRLPDGVDLGQLPHTVDGLPALGIADDTLGVMGFSLDEPLLVCGPPQANRPAFVLSMVQSIVRARGGQRVALLTARNTALTSAYSWAHCIEGGDAVVKFAKESLTDGTLDLLDGLVLANVPDLTGSAFDLPLQDLVKALLAARKWVIAEADANVVTGAYGVSQMIRASRHGLALQPDQNEGNDIFRTPFPKGSRAEFPTGRGYYVRHGRATKVQCALPTSDVPAVTAPR